MDLEKYYAKPGKTLLEHTQDVKEQLKLMKEFGLIKSDRIFYLADKACYWHDFGKANREFQKRIQNHTKFNENIEIAHNVLSLYFIKPEDFENEEEYMKVAYAVLTHHNYCDESEVVNSKGELIEDLLSEFKNDVKSIGSRKLRKIFSMVTDDETILTKGLLHRCDYSASAGIRVEYNNDFLTAKLASMINEWKRNNPETAWNSLQKFCQKNANKNIIVTAQTGMGKTEAGLLWMGDNKGFFILPIKVAINSIYDRITNNILHNENIGSRVALLHSDIMTYYAGKANVDEITVGEYYTRSKQLSMPITVTTLDQVFDFVFKYPGYEMKLVTLSYSKIIIDEIQMYGPDLLAFLTYGITMVNKFGGKIAILTATLSPFVKDILIEKGFMEEVVEASFTNDLQRHNVKVYESYIDPKIISEKFYENKNNFLGNKILVICNTVKKAQEIYQQLAELIDESELNILHNKFIKKDRSEKEKEILEFGRTYDDNKNVNLRSGIWVSTSIVEASLDIDFDYIFTELSDLNGLFQRLGRCNRKGIKDVSDYNCFVFTEIDRNILRHGDKGFIDDTIYKLSKEAIKTVDGILSESMKMKLINSYFTTDNLSKSAYIRDFNEVYDYISSLEPNEVEKNEAKLRNILSYSIIPEDVYYNNYDLIEMNLEKLQEPSISLEKKTLMIDEIRQYTLSVEPYILKQSKVTNVIKINRDEIIKIIDCYYTKLGFQMKKNNGYTIF